MSKLDLTSRVPDKYDKAVFTEIIRVITGQLNPLSEGRITAKYNARSVVPSGSAVAYAVGDFIPNNNATVASSVAPGSGLNYVNLGWVCRVAGSPGTFEEVRVLTGGGSVYQAVNPAPLTSSLGADVSLNNTANYFDGPSVAQGTSGTWFVSGTVTCKSTASDNLVAKLWDGTTVIASTAFATNGTSSVSVALSGFISSPAGNLRISVRDIDTTNGKILFNQSGNSKDSTISAFRLA